MQWLRSQQKIRTFQQGVSLISLLVSIIISMIAMMAMWKLFQTTVHNTTQASRDVRITGERSTGLLISSMRLQIAGYGLMKPSRADDLLLLRGTSVGTGNILSGTTVVGDGEGNALIWHYDLMDGSGNSHRCAGLYAPAGADEKGLYELTEKACTSVSQAMDSAWQLRPLIFDVKDIADPLSASIIIDTSVACRGLGVAGSGAVNVSLSVNEVTGNQIKSTTCLMNFVY